MQTVHMLLPKFLFGILVSTTIIFPGTSVVKHEPVTDGLKRPTPNKRVHPVAVAVTKGFDSPCMQRARQQLRAVTRML